jgi:hypothetical protein
MQCRRAILTHCVFQRISYTLKLMSNLLKSVEVRFCLLPGGGRRGGFLVAQLSSLVVELVTMTFFFMRTLNITGQTKLGSVQLRMAFSASGLVALLQSHLQRSPVRAMVFSASWRQAWL